MSDRETGICNTIVKQGIPLKNKKIEVILNREPNIAICGINGFNSKNYSHGQNGQAMSFMYDTPSYGSYHLSVGNNSLVSLEEGGCKIWGLTREEENNCYAAADAYWKQQNGS